MDLLDRLLGHDAWTTRKLLEHCRTLDDERLDREHDFAHKSVRATFVHLVGTWRSGPTSWQACPCARTRTPIRRPLDRRADRPARSRGGRVHGGRAHGAGAGRLGRALGRRPRRPAQHEDLRRGDRPRDHALDAPPRTGDPAPQMGRRTHATRRRRAELGGAARPSSRTP